MTSLPKSTEKKLGLVIDLDICVGCHACAVSCKEWNAGGHSAPLTDYDPYGEEPSGVWFNRIHASEVKDQKQGIVTMRLVFRSVQPVQFTNVKKTVLCW